MENFAGKVAFITGGGSGIGLEIARSLAKRGAKIMLADIDPARLATAKADLRGIHADIDTVICDVADPISVQAAADATVRAFGKVHIVVNNAGVSLAGNTGNIPLADWRWIVDINLMGVVHGIEIFTPLMRAHGEGGYFVNTASMAGHLAAPQLGPYNATKFAVVGLSETIRQDLAKDNIGVSVLCPGFVKTDIANAYKNRPSGGSDTATAASPETQNLVDLVEGGIAASLVGEYTADCIAAGRFYIFTAPELLPYLDQRADRIKTDYAAAATHFTVG